MLALTRMQRLTRRRFTLALPLVGFAHGTPHCILLSRLPLACRGLTVPPLGLLASQERRLCVTSRPAPLLLHLRRFRLQLLPQSRLSQLGLSQRCLHLRRRLRRRWVRCHLHCRRRTREGLQPLLFLRLKLRVAPPLGFLAARTFGLVAPRVARQHSRHRARCNACAGRLDSSLLCFRLLRSLPRCRHACSLHYTCM